MSRLYSFQRSIGNIFILIWFVPSMVMAQGSVPLVSTVLLAEATVESGAVVIFDSATESYRYGVTGEGVEFYGVVVERPPLFVEHSVSEVPLVVDGVAMVQVTDTNGIVRRGDTLRISSIPGVAERSSESDDVVFAIALESITDESSTILADISPARAFAWQQQAEIPEVESVRDGQLSAGAIAATTARIVLALGIGIGALAFILYTYRSIWVTGVTAVGRNPRAQTAVLLMNIASSVVLVALAIFVVIVALGVLVVTI